MLTFSEETGLVAAPAFCGGQESYGFSYSIILLYCKQITGKPSNCNPYDSWPPQKAGAATVETYGSSKAEKCH